jgi:hypothetical protein
LINLSFRWTVPLSQKIWLFHFQGFPLQRTDSGKPIHIHG